MRSVLDPEIKITKPFLRFSAEDGEEAVVEWRVTCEDGRPSLVDATGTVYLGADLIRRHGNSFAREALIDATRQICVHNYAPRAGNQIITAMQDVLAATDFLALVGPHALTSERLQ